MHHDLRQKTNAFPGRLLSVFFGSRKAAAVSSLFGIAVLVLLYSIYLQVKEATQVELPTGQPDQKTSTVSPAQFKVAPEILILNSYHKGHTWSDKETEGISEVLREASPDIKFFIEYMDCKRHPKYEHFEPLKDLLIVKYGTKEIPIVIVIDNPAF